MTMAQVYDSQGKVTNTLRSKVGAKGVEGENIAQATSSTTEYVHGESGENSLWIDKGGGTPGKCEDGRYGTPYPQKYTDYETKTTSIGMHWKVGAVAQTFNGIHTAGVKMNCPERENQKHIV